MPAAGALNVDDEKFTELFRLLKPKVNNESHTLYIDMFTYVHTHSDTHAGTHTHTHTHTSIDMDMQHWNGI